MSQEYLALSHEAVPKESLKPTTEARFYAIETAPHQTTRVIEVDARPSDNTGYEHTIIWPAAFQARAELVNRERIRVLADQLQAKVLYVETPGITVDLEDPCKKEGLQNITPSRMDVRAAFGDFRQQSKAQLLALHEAVPFHNDETLHILGYSMGANSATYMTQQLGEQPFGADLTPKIARLDFLDPVNDQNWRLLDLIKAIQAEGEFANEYANENRKLELELPPFHEKHDEKESERIRKYLLKQQWLAIHLGGAGLRSAFAPILEQAILESRHNNTTEVHEADITFFRANGSLVGRQEKHEATAHDLKERTNKTLRQIELNSVGEGNILRHAFARSFSRLAHLALQDFARG